MEDSWKVRMNICTALWSFVNFCCLSQSGVSTDDRKVSTFFYIPTCSLPLLLSFLSGSFLKHAMYNTIQMCILIPGYHDKEARACLDWKVHATFLKYRRTVTNNVSIKRHLQRPTMLFYWKKVTKIYQQQWLLYMLNIINSLSGVSISTNDRQDTSATFSP